MLWAFILACGEKSVMILLWERLPREDPILLVVTICV